MFMKVTVRENKPTGEVSSISTSPNWIPNTTEQYTEHLFRCGNPDVDCISRQ